MKKFKTESKRLLDLMINSIYTNREIFLRELISNASDALDRIYLASLTDRSIEVMRGELGIKLAFDSEKRTITVSDNGIGMTQSELDKNLGTIAYSGSLDFKQDMEAEQAKAETTTGETGEADGKVEAKAGGKAGGKAELSAIDAVTDLIGQFGVGFYSGFMVAAKVEVISRAVGEEQAWEWSSNGIDGYNIEASERADHGTDVILTLKEDTDDENYSLFLSEYELESLVKKYSNYVRYPISMEKTQQRELEAASDSETDGSEADGSVEDDSEIADDREIEYESYTEWVTLNSMTPIWKRQKSDVSDEEYAEFYKSDFHDYAAPAASFSIKAEGALNYDVLLFIPAHAPYDLYHKDFEKGLALYSSNVMIMEKCPDLLSDHFSFVRGVVDSADLDLNISRETLQKNNQLRAMAKRIEKKITSELTTMMEQQRESYEGVFASFGRIIKYGIYSSFGSLKDSLAPLLLYYSAKQERLLSLREYLDAAPAEQEAIYYAAGEDATLLAKMPMVKSVLSRGFDVLLCTQEVDDFVMDMMREYDEKPLKNVAGANLGLETAEEQAQKDEKAKEYSSLFAAMQEILGEKVSKVTLSTRLDDMAAGISAEGPVSLEMERILAAMPDAEGMGGIGGISSQRVLELNAAHPVFAQLVAALADDRERLALLTNVLYNQALMVEGLQVDDPVEFAHAIGQLLA